MPGAISRLEGVGASLAALRKLDDHVQTKIGKRALKGAAQKLASRVRANAKVSTRPDNKTKGSLRNSVTDKPGRAKKGVTTHAVIAADVAAVPKELGLTRRNYPPEPFFRPAIDAGREEAAQSIADVIKEEVESGAWK